MSQTVTLTARQRTTASANMAYISWALSHLAQLPALMEDFQAIMAAQGVNAKWAALKTLFDLLISMGADFPGFSIVAPTPSPTPTPSPSPSPAPSPGPIGPIGPIVSTAAYGGDVDAMITAHAAAFGDGTLLREAFTAFIDNLPKIVNIVSTILMLL